MSSLFTGFAELCQRLSETTKKLEKRAAMAEYLRSLDVANAARAAQWLTGEAFGAQGNLWC
jgi:DNA ligase-1